MSAAFDEGRLTQSTPFSPLGGVRVLDLTRILSGPYCTLLLADLGADVIKIEQPLVGDDARHWGPPFVDDMSAYFASVNRGKKSVALDLRDHRDLDCFRSLVARSDVLVENYRPGVTERLAISFEAMREINDRLIYCSITAFDPGAPHDRLPGTEVIVEAFSGLMAITGLPDGPPVRFGAAMVDIATGLSAAAGVLAALLERGRTGKGRKIDCSLYRTSLWSLLTIFSRYLVSGEEPGRHGSSHPSIVPYAAYPTRDGWAVIGALNDGAWHQLCRTLDLGHLAARPDLGSNAGRVLQRELVEREVAGVTRRWTTGELVARLTANGLLAAPVRNISEVVEEAIATGQLTTFDQDGPVPVVRLPFCDDTLLTTRAPKLNEHRFLVEIGSRNDDDGMQNTSTLGAATVAARSPLPTGTSMDAAAKTFDRTVNEPNPHPNP